MSKIKRLKEPFILDESFLKENLVQVIKHAEVRRLVEEDGLNLSQVLSLNLERHYILNITCLWRFASLEKLEMRNNIIEKIEGLDTLTNLTVLDLSFNYIEHITGLENLINLVQLNLTSNEIQVLKNMDNLRKLETFLIRYNKIKFFDSILYLRQFENLACLGIAENPVLQEKDAMLHVIAALPRLKYLDHQLITEKSRVEAIEKFPMFSDEFCKIASNNRTQVDIDDEAKKDLVTLEEMNTLHMNSYVDGLMHNQLFDSMFQNDKNGTLLISFPPASSIANDYRMAIECICREWFDWGLKINDYRDMEKKQYQHGIESARSYTLKKSRDEISEFITFREQTLKKLGAIYLGKNEKVIQDEVAHLKNSCKIRLCELWKALMKFAALRVELINEMGWNLLNILSEIDKKYFKDIEKYPPKLMEAHKEFSTHLTEFYFEWFESGSNWDIEVKDAEGKPVELDPEFIKMMQQEDIVEASLLRGRDIHLSVLNEKLRVIKTRMKNCMLQTLKETQKEEIKIYRRAVKEITLFCNKQHSDIELFFISLKVEDYVIFK